MTDTIVALIHDIILKDIQEQIPLIANRSLSYHELEAIFFNQGNGYRLFRDEGFDDHEWDCLPTKERAKWNSKAKKALKESMGICQAARKDGSPCTTRAKENGFCGKHKNNAESQKLAEEIAFKMPELKKVEMKKKKIEGKFYLVDDEHRAFSLKEKELVGIYNPDTQRMEHGDELFDNSSINEDTEPELSDIDI